MWYKREREENFLYDRTGHLIINSDAVRSSVDILTANEMFFQRCSGHLPETGLWYNSKPPFSTDHRRHNVGRVWPAASTRLCSKFRFFKCIESLISNPTVFLRTNGPDKSCSWYMQPSFGFLSPYNDRTSVVHKDLPVNWGRRFIMIICQIHTKW